MKNILITVGISAILIAAFYFIKNWYLRPGLENGLPAAEIISTLPNGQSFALSDLKGKYVLLDFWGSWCKPCRESNPELVKLYNDFHAASFKSATGFEIISYGVERNKESWKAAIAADRLKWPYQLVSADMFNDPVIRAYNVKQIPTKFLISPKGIIIAVDPTISEIRKLLKTYLSP